MILYEKMYPGSLKAHQRHFIHMDHSYYSQNTFFKKISAQFLVINHSLYIQNEKFLHSKKKV